MKGRHLAARWSLRLLYRTWKMRASAPKQSRLCEDDFPHGQFIDARVTVLGACSSVRTQRSVTVSVTLFIRPHAKVTHATLGHVRACTDAQRLRSARPTSLHGRGRQSRCIRGTPSRGPLRDRMPELAEDRHAGAAPDVHHCESEGRYLNDRTRSPEDRLQQGFSHGQLSYAVLHRRVHQLRARLRGLREGLPRDGVAGDGGLREGVPGLPGDLSARDGPHAAYVADERGDLSRVCGRVRCLREGVRSAHVRALPSMRRGMPRVCDRVPPDGGRRVAATAHPSVALDRVAVRGHALTALNLTPLRRDAFTSRRSGSPRVAHARAR